MTDVSKININGTSCNVKEDTAITNKVNEVTTLEGYSVADSYNKSEVDAFLALKADKTTTYTKDESKRNFGLFENVRAHGIVAGDESKAEDNAEKIQSLIQYCYDNGIGTIYFPEGNYYVSEPIYLYEYMEIRGQSQYNTHITKTTHQLDRNGVDSVIVFENNEDNKKSSTTNGQKVKCIDIAGNTTGYLLVNSDTGDFLSIDDAASVNSRPKLDTNYKVESSAATSGERQVAIYAHTNSPYVVIEEVETHNVDHAIDLKGAWIGRFSKLKIRSYYIGFRVRSECQGIVLTGINVLATREYGFYLTGSNYNSLNAIFVEWAYGGVAFYFGWGTYSINGIGYEISRNLTDGIYVYRANVQITNAMLPQQNLEEFSAIHARTNSVVDIVSTAYGFQSQKNDSTGDYTDLRTGRLYKAEYGSKICLRNSVRCGLVNCEEFPKESICDNTSEAVCETMNNLNAEFISGYLTIPTELTDYISVASFYCQRIGRAAITSVVITASQNFPDTITDSTAVTLEGLPYTCFGHSTRQVTPTTNQNMKSVMVLGNTSSFRFFGGLKAGESITATVTYMIAKTQ